MLGKVRATVETMDENPYKSPVTQYRQAEQRDVSPSRKWLVITATAIAALAVPIVVAVLGNEINLSLKDRDVKIKTVELAISILKDDPKQNPESPVLREWAMTVIDNYSGVPLPDAAREELKTQPITRAGSFSISCQKIPASLEYRSHTAVTVLEDDQGCYFSVNGASQDMLSAQCPTIPAYVYARTAVSASEFGGRCIFDLGG